MASLSAPTRTAARTAFPLSRAAVRQPALRRFAHSEARDPHDNAIPFSTHNRKALAAKMLAYLGLGFSIPFVAVWWQWNRPGGIHNPQS